MSSNSSKKNIINGLAALVAVIALVSIVGYYAAKPSGIIIQGEAESPEYRVSGKIPGRVKEFYVKEGDAVKQGDTLALIDTPELLAKLSQAEAAQMAAEAQNRKAEKGARSEQIAAAWEMLQKAEAGVDISKKTYDRVNALYEKEVLPAQKRDEAEAQLKAAIATRNAAKTQYDMAVNGAEKEDKEAALALAMRARGAVNEVKSYLDEMYVIAPASGEISEIFPNRGELVGPGAPIFSIIDLEDTWITFNLREDLLNGIDNGVVIDVKIPALGGREVKAKVTYLKAMASYATWRATKVSGEYDAKSFEVRAVPVSKVDGLRPGMTVLMEMR